MIVPSGSIISNYINELYMASNVNCIEEEIRSELLTQTIIALEKAKEVDAKIKNQIVINELFLIACNCTNQIILNLLIEELKIDLIIVIKRLTINNYYLKINCFCTTYYSTITYRFISFIFVPYTWIFT